MPGRGFDPEIIKDAYGSVADDYATKFGDDLAELPLDRSLLEVVAVRCAGRGLVLDLGCGPAYVAEYLMEHGVDCAGVDFTPAMLTVARRRLPNMPAATGDIRRLPVRAGAVAGIAVFYVLQHLDRSTLVPVFAELRRVLTEGGMLLVAAHAGHGEFVPAPEIRATRYTDADLRRACSATRFAVEAVHHRPPLTHEHQGDRVYVLARAR